MLGISNSSAKALIVTRIQNRAKVTLGFHSVHNYISYRQYTLWQTNRLLGVFLYTAVIFLVRILPRRTVLITLSRSAAHHSLFLPTRPAYWI